MAADTPVNRRTIEKRAIPQLKKLGLEAVVGWVDTTDIGSIYMGSEQAAITFASGGIDRVMFLGGSRLASIFATIAGSKQFKATYAISSFDNPSFFVNNPDTVPSNTMDGMVGIGFHPPQDVPDSEMSFPAGGAETECIDVYTKAGIKFDSREAARIALPYCDAVRLLKLGADGVERSAQRHHLEQGGRRRRRRLPDGIGIRQRDGRRRPSCCRRLPGDAFRRGLQLLRVQG